MLNLTPPPLKVSIAQRGQPEANWLDVTPNCASGGFWTATRDPIDESGIIRVSGSLRLVPLLGQEELFHPWISPGWWKAGNQVHIKVFQNGRWYFHTFTGLFILTTPNPPQVGDSSLSIELGDYTSYKESENAPGDASGVTAGITTNYGTVASNILNKIGVPLSPRNLNGETKEIQPRRENEPSYVAQAGLVSVAGGAFLYSNGAGARLITIDLNPATVMLTHRTGVDDAADPELLQALEKPIDSVAAINPEAEGDSELEDDLDGEGGIGTGGSEGEEETDGDEDESGSRSSPTYAPRSTITGNEDDSGSILIGRKTETWGWKSATQFVRRIEESSARGLLIPDDLIELIGQSQGREIIGIPDATAIISASVSIETHTYEGGREGRLENITLEVDERNGAVLGDYYRQNPPKPGETLPPLMAMIPSIRQTTVYSYDAKDGDKELTDSIVTEKREPRAKIAADANDWQNYLGGRTTLTLSERNSTFWRKKRRNSWEQEEKQELAGQVRSGGVAAYLALSKVENPTTISRSGTTQPPEPERRKGDPEKTRQIKKQKESVAKVAEGLDGLERAIENPYATEEDQQQWLAQFFLKLNRIRQRAIRVVSAVPIFQYSPMGRVDLLYGGRWWQALSDSETCMIADNQMIWTLDLAIAGRHLSTPVPVPAPLPTDTEEIPLLEPGTSLEPIAPTVTLLTELLSTVGLEFEVVQLPTITSFEGGTIELESEIGLEFRATPPVSFEVGLEFEALRLFNSEIGLEFEVEIVSNALVAHYPLEGAPWEDVAGSADLTASFSPTTIAGVQGNAARLSSGSMLQSSNAVLSGGNQHWKWQFYVQMVSPPFEGSAIYFAERRGSSYTEWELSHDTNVGDTGQFRLQLSNSSFEGVTITTPFLTDYFYGVGWLAFEIEYFPDTQEVRLAIDETEYTATFPGIPTAESDSTFTLQCQDGALAIDEVKFFVYPE